MDRTKAKKKKLLMSRRKARRIAGFVSLGILVLAVAVYIFFDSRSYVATVDGNRIMIYEYEFLLKQQILQTEQNEGLSGKTDAEKKAYWTSTENGQNPFETAKNESLNAAKEYRIQLNKAYEMGLKVDGSVKSAADQYIKSYQQTYSFSDAQLADFIKEKTGVSINDFRKILENTNLIDKFKALYIKNNYKEPALTDEEVKSEYDKDPKQFDTVDISYVILTKTDASTGAALSQAELDKKKAAAREALKQIQAGTDIGTVFTKYSDPSYLYGVFGESTPGKATVHYTSGMNQIQPLLDYLFNNPVGSSGVVETDSFIFAVKIDNRSGYEDLKTSIKTYLENKRQSDWYNKQLDQWNLDPKYNIIENDSVYDSISYK